MSKELEALNYVYDKLRLSVYLGVVESAKIDSAKKCIEQALQRLEAIDNANPSEALECLEELRSNLGVIYNNTLDNIEQALLKQQEPKNYLKWEDLEFKKQRQVMDVSLNGKPYVLYFYKLSTQSEVNMFSVDMHIVTLNSYYPEDVQFFNDLHLERVEE